MEKRFMKICLLIQVIWISALLCVRELQISEIAVRATFAAEEVDEQEPLKLVMSHLDFAKISSGQRVVEVEYLKKMHGEDYEILTRIVEAEAGGEDTKGKMLVAGVVLNRVAAEEFPNTVHDVVFQNSGGVSQFAPVSDGRYYTVTVSESTREAVDRVLSGEDVSQGALYFVSRDRANPGRMKWFDNHLTFLFSYGGHEFFN